MNEATNTTHHETTHYEPIAIYKHHNCPEWGVATIAWERADRRGYQFEDGKLRIFTRPYYDRLVEVDQPLDKAAALTAQLQRKIDRDMPSEHATTAVTPAISFDDQLRIFVHEYPGGFEDAAWRARIRGIDAKRRIKRHRAPAIAEAAERLAAPRLDQMIAENRTEQAWNDILAVLSATDLASKRQLEPVRHLTPDGQRRFVIAARALLWGEDRHALRFERWVGALASAGRREPSWQLATALSALVSPAEHICVRPTSFRAQAAWMAPRVVYSRIPNAMLYERYLRMARRVRDKLIEAGHTPRDLLDVYDFMWNTLRPSAIKMLGELPRSDEGAALKDAA